MSSVSITRVTSLTPEVYDYALAAYQLLFAPRAADPSAIPADLRNFNEVYCRPGGEGCFLVARDSSLLLPTPPPTPLPPTTTSSPQVTIEQAAGAPPSATAPGEGPIVGILAYRPYIHRFLAPSGTLRPELIWPDQKTVEVVRLFVSPQCRGKRLAQKLVQAMVEEAKRDGVEVLYLHTQPFLVGAEELWRKMGWGVLGRDQDQWESIHMVRKL